MNHWLLCALGLLLARAGLRGGFLSFPPRQNPAPRGLNCLGFFCAASAVASNNRFPFVLDVDIRLPAMTEPRRIVIFDTTLRDGEQSPGRA